MDEEVFSSNICFTVPAYYPITLLLVFVIAEKKLRDSEKGTSPGDDNSPHGHGSPSKTSNNIHAEDMRPREEYDEPWEWSQTHSMIFDHMVNNDTGSGGSGGQNRSTPLMTKRTTADTNTTERPPGFGTIVAEAEASITSMSLQLQEQEEQQQQQQEGEQSGSPDVEEVIDPPEEADVLEVVEEPERYDYENMKDDYSIPVPEKPPENMTEEEYERYTQLREEYERTQVRQCPENDKRVGNYEEPWDLSSTQKDLEDRIRAHVSAAGTSGGTVTVTNDDTPSTQAIPQLELSSTEITNTNAQISPSGPPVVPDGDSRPQEGYEPPWDWKPHKKDERGQDGYEKPWDWKPHQKDDRPGEEYEQPWDHKVQSIEGNLMKAKREGGDNLIEKLDHRPTDEYEEPWDQKQKAMMLSRTGGCCSFTHFSSAKPYCLCFSDGHFPFKKPVESMHVVHSQFRVG